MHELQPEETHDESPPRRPYAQRMSREDRREQLLDSTLRVIAKKGYDAVTITAVAREAGVTRPVVYNIFPTLEDLLSELFERQGSRIFGQIARSLQVASPGSEPVELWAASLRRFLDDVTEETDTWRLILFPPSSTPPAVQRRMDDARRQIAGALSKLIGWGLRRRGLPLDTDVEMFTIFSMQMFEQLGRLLLSDPQRFPPERIMQFVDSFFAFASAGRAPEQLL